MMGVQEPDNSKIFYTNLNTAERVRRDHPLRRIAARVDFDFTYKEVADRYGTRGNVSAPPPVVLKLMLLLVSYNVRSERELMATLPERLDWIWFLGYDLDTKIPDHSILSKARKRWGAEVFRNFFERVVLQCVEAGLVDGSKIFVDSSLVEADASNNSVIDTQSLKHQLRSSYRELEARLEERQESDGRSDRSGSYRKVNDRYISGTDPDAAIVGRGKPDLFYQVHRSVDEAHEIITATAVTPGDVSEGHMLEELLQRHRRTTGKAASTVVADSKYGTIDNFLACYDKGTRTHMPDLSGSASAREEKRGIFTETHFCYDQKRDIYICPAGKELRPKSLHRDRGSIDYAASRTDCEGCPLRTRCTSNKMGRTVKRHCRQEDLDVILEQSRCEASRKDIRKRQRLMERSFARSKRYGYDRARWRGLWRMSIQEYLTCAVQNIQVLLKGGGRSAKDPAVIARILEPGLSRVCFLFSKILRRSCLAYIEQPVTCPA
ncbi:MAG: IS1182 family transposase [Synergistota bacterium]|nr:IS1182 family transposase [Synergistota bacterium]